MQPFYGRDWRELKRAGGDERTVEEEETIRLFMSSIAAPVLLIENLTFSFKSTKIKMTAFPKMHWSHTDNLKNYRTAPFK